MLRCTHARAALAGALMLAAASPAMAAGSDTDDWGWSGWRHGPMMMQGRGGRHMMGDAWFESMIERVDGRLAYMRAELKITDGQAPQWDAFAAAVHSGAEAHNALMRSMHETFADRDLDKMTLPERLAFQQSHLEARLEQVKATKDAANNLYAVLSDAQKKTADDIVLPMMGMGPGMMFW